jgi:hypothetical protein
MEKATTGLLRRVLPTIDQVACELQQYLKKLCKHFL